AVRGQGVSPERDDPPVLVEPPDLLAGGRPPQVESPAGRPAREQRLAVSAEGEEGGLTRAAPGLEVQAFDRDLPVPQLLPRFHFPGEGGGTATRAKRLAVGGRGDVSHGLFPVPVEAEAAPLLPRGGVPGGAREPPPAEQRLAVRGDGDRVHPAVVPEADRP